MILIPNLFQVKKSIFRIHKVKNKSFKTKPQKYTLRPFYYQSNIAKVFLNKKRVQVRLMKKMIIIKEKINIIMNKIWITEWMRKSNK